MNYDEEFIREGSEELFDFLRNNLTEVMTSTRPNETYKHFYIGEFSINKIIIGASINNVNKKTLYWAHFYSDPHGWAGGRKISFDEVIKLISNKYKKLFLYNLDLFL